MQIADIRRRHAVPIVVGGTFYYVDSILWDNFLTQQEVPFKDDRDPLADSKESAADFKVAAKSSDRLSSSELYARLQHVDPTMAAKLHPNDRRKIERSLEGL